MIWAGNESVPLSGATTISTFAPPASAGVEIVTAPTAVSPPLMEAGVMVNVWIEDVALCFDGLEAESGQGILKLFVNQAEPFQHTLV